MQAKTGTQSPVKLDHLIACHACDLVHCIDDIKEPHIGRCVRCGELLYKVRPYGPETCLALSVTGVILFILSNTFPLLTFALEGRSQSSFLISGVIEFWHAGYWDLAILVFCTAVLFPIMYIASVLYVFLPLRFNCVLPLAAYIFRFSVSLKPWAMIEVFLLGVIVGFVKLMDIADITVGIGLYCFSLLILVNAGIATMLDPRMVWLHPKVNK